MPLSACASQSAPDARSLEPRRQEPRHRRSPRTAPASARRSRSAPGAPPQPPSRRRPSPEARSLVQPDVLMNNASSRRSPTPPVRPPQCSVPQRRLGYEVSLLVPDLTTTCEYCRLADSAEQVFACGSRQFSKRDSDGIQITIYGFGIFYIKRMLETYRSQYLGPHSHAAQGRPRDPPHPAGPMWSVDLVPPWQPRRTVVRNERAPLQLSLRRQLRSLSDAAQRRWRTFRAPVRPHLGAVRPRLRS